MTIRGLPVALGGRPVRTEGFRRTPEVGTREVLYTAAQIGCGSWEPAPENLGVAVASGLTVPEVVAEFLGGELGALAAEFVAIQAPDQDVVAVPLNNGTHAIRVILAALTKVAPELGLRTPNVDGDEVIVPAMTWQATAGAALRRNLVPVLVDVEPGTLCIDPEAFRAAITDRTVAIVPVHLYNRMANMEEILAIAEPLGIAVIEDCAHAHGAVYRGQGAGTLGVAGTFSMQGSKSLSSQEGGFVLAKHPPLVDQLCSLVTCGRAVGSSQLLQADNDRMAGIIAALARAQLIRFVEQNMLRLRTFAELDLVAARSPGIRGLNHQPGDHVPPTYKWPFRVDLDRWMGLTIEQIQECLERELGCEFARPYKPLTNSTLYQPLSDPAHSFLWDRVDPARFSAPEADRAYEEVLVVEHAAGLDPAFPAAFEEAVHKLLDNAEQLAAELS